MVELFLNQMTIKIEGQNPKNLMQVCPKIALWLCPCFLLKKLKLKTVEKLMIKKMMTQHSSIWI